MFWQRIEAGLFENTPHYLDEDDTCYYAREYIARGGYTASECNQLVLNFKKDPSRRQNQEWQYKEQAINQFARELALGLNPLATVCFVPPSKSATAPDYDDRFEMLMARLSQMVPSLNCQQPFTLPSTIQASHAGGERDPVVLYQSLQWTGFSTTPKSVVVVDDVITSGGHFKACTKMIQENHPDIDICGMFWARAVERDEDNGDALLL